MAELSAGGEGDDDGASTADAGCASCTWATPVAGACSTVLYSKSSANHSSATSDHVPRILEWVAPENALKSGPVEERAT